MKNERNINLDILRFFGLFIIMIAHTVPPEWLFQLRNFGTPLLVFSSGLTYAYIYQRREIHAFNFVKKRTFNLIYSSWLFLLLFFMFFMLTDYMGFSNTQFNMKIITDSFLYKGGIGYLWIFKIYLILAIFTPLCIRVNNSKISNFKIGLIIVFIYALYELALSFQKLKTSMEIFFNFIPYLLIYICAFRFNTLRTKDILIISSISLFIFIYLLISLYLKNGHFIPTQEYKYPPRLYYLSYAMFFITLLYVTTRYLVIKKDSIIALVKWLSGNSLKFYLWHIFILYASTEIFNYEYSTSNFLRSLLMVISCTLIATYCHNKTKELMSKTKFK